MFNIDDWNQLLKLRQELNLHDFLLQPEGWTAGGGTVSPIWANTPDRPILHVLREAVKAAGLSGKIVITGLSLQDSAHFSLCVLDPALMPKQWKDWLPVFDLEFFHYYRWDMGSISRYGFLPDISWFLYLCRNDPNHPLHPFLLTAPEGAIGVWGAWGGEHPYRDIPQWQPIYLAVNGTAEATLAAGVVVICPETGERVKITLDRSEYIDAENWFCTPMGEQLLRIEPTEEPLTKTVPERESGLQVFGCGYSRHDANAPEVAGVPARTLLVWWNRGGKGDYCITISLSGRFAWAEGG